MDDAITINDEILSTVKSAIKAALVYESLTGGKRKLGITGEVGEILTCYHLGLRLSIDPRSEGFDAIDKDGLRVQIKSRKSESKGMPRDVGRTGTFSKHKFDYALLSILDNNYQLCEVWRAEYNLLHPIIERNKRRNPSLSSFKKVGRKIFEAGSKLNEVQEDKMEENSHEKKATSSRQNGKDRSKYSFNGKEYSKRRLVLAIVEYYLKVNPKATFEDLIRAFPDKFQGGSKGVVRKKEAIKDYRRYFMDSPLTTFDGVEVVVCGEWGAIEEKYNTPRQDINNFIEYVENSVGYKIKRIER